MRWLDKMSNSIKKGIRSWLHVQPAQPYAIQIQEIMDFELSAIRNRIWYRGDGNEIEQMYKQNPEYADQTKFWASRCSGSSPAGLTGPPSRRTSSGIWLNGPPIW